MKPSNKSLRFRLIESTCITVGLFVVMIYGAWTYPYRHKHFPDNVDLAEAILALFALYACVVVVPVIFKGSWRQRLLALAIAWLPASAVWHEVGRVIYIFQYSD